MSDFKAKMHQIVCRLTPLGELTALPRPPSWILWGLLLRDERRREGGESREGEEKGKGRGGEGGDSVGPQS